MVGNLRFIAISLETVHSWLIITVKSNQWECQKLLIKPHIVLEILKSPVNVFTCVL